MIEDQFCVTYNVSNAHNKISEFIHHKLSTMHALKTFDIHTSMSLIIKHN